MTSRGVLSLPGTTDAKQSRFLSKFHLTSPNIPHTSRFPWQIYILFTGCSVLAPPLRANWYFLDARDLPSTAEVLVSAILPEASMSLSKSMTKQAWEKEGAHSSGKAASGSGEVLPRAPRMRALRLHGSALLCHMQDLGPLSRQGPCGNPHHCAAQEPSEQLLEKAQGRRYSQRLWSSSNFCPCAWVGSFQLTQTGTWRCALGRPD